MSRAVSPRFHHRFFRHFGIVFRGVKGVDRMLRVLHSPEHRRQWYLQTETAALWGGPKFCLETRWFTEWQTYFYGSQDRGLHRWMKNNVREDWICFDVGMNFGFYACVCAQLCREVHGFEPVAALLKRAEHNRNLNGLTNLSLNQIALSDREGILSFYLPRAESSNWGMGSLVHDQQGEVVKVSCTTLDCYCRERDLKRLDFIKIDVEGAEHLVLQGAIQALAKFRPKIIFENNSDSRELAFRTLEDCGYSLHRLSGESVDRNPDAKNDQCDLLALPKPR